MGPTFTNWHHINSESERERKLEGLSRAHTLTPTLTFDPDLPKFNHLVPCGQEYD